MSMRVKKLFSIITLLTALNFIYAKNYSPEEAEKLRTAVIAKAKTYIGCPYKTGAIGPDYFDCSGLIYTSFREGAGIQLPRSVRAIYSAVKIVSTDQLEEGDLVFFKTTGDGSISHVGLYIGRNQFIHAASDGSNTGVIASSLTEKYYKNCFAGVGKPLSSAKKNLTQTQQSPSEKKEEDSSSQSASSSSESESSSEASNSSFASNLAIDATVAGDWNLWLPNKFMINFRGLTFTGIVRYTKWKIQPGLGTTIRWNYGTDCVQLPVLFSLSFNDYVSIYMGPVFTLGTPQMPETKVGISGSLFPGVAGISFTTPSIKAGKVRISLCQDIIYTVFNDYDGGALSFGDSLCAGLVFSTGIRVTLPLKNVLK